jgi:hypothetical protein
MRWGRWAHDPDNAILAAMGRLARRAVGGLVYHVLNRGNGRAEVFHKPGDYDAFLRIMAEAKQVVPGMRLLAFCLMPNHWHLALWPRADGELAIVVPIHQDWEVEDGHTGKQILWLVVVSNGLGFVSLAVALAFLH